jgi:hypothetical protein
MVPTALPAPPTPLSGGDRKALTKEIAKSRTITGILVERSRESAGSAKLLNTRCKVRNELLMFRRLRPFVLKCEKHPTNEGHNRRTTMFKRFLGIVIFTVVISSDAFSQQSLQQLEGMSQFEQALAAVDAIKHRKKLQCVLAIANGALCDCLSRKLPVDTYLRSYASIANQEKEGLEYGQLSAADKKIVDQCVKDNR